MGARGPRPKPGELQAARGNPGKRKNEIAPDTVPTLTGDAPDWLTDDVARGAWIYILDSLSPLRLVRETDHIAVARYCDHFARWLRLRDKVNDAGETYVTESNHGTMQRINPDFVAMHREEDRMEKLEDRIGLTPSSRQRLMQGLAAGGQVPAPVPGQFEMEAPGSASSGGSGDMFNEFVPSLEGKPN